MADTMTLYHPTTGEPTTFDPAEYDSSAMLKDKYTRQAPRITVKEHQRSRPQRKPGEKSGWQKATDLIPPIAATVGAIPGAAVGAATGAFGGPAGVTAGTKIGQTAGATVGGAGGEALRQLLTEIPALATGGVPGYEDVGGPASAGDAFKRIADVGAEQGAADVLGQGAGKVGRAVGKGAMQLAMRVTPEVAQTAISEGIAMTKQGVTKMMNKLGEFGQRKLAMLRQNNTRFDPMQLLREGWPALKKEVDENQTGLKGEIYDQYIEDTRKFMAAHAPNGVLKDMTAAELDKFRHDAFEIADPIFTRIAKNEQVSLLDKATAKWHYAMGKAAQQALERTTPDMVDPVTKQALTLAEVNARTGRLIELKNHIAPDVEQKTFMSEAVKRGVPIATSASGALAGEELGRRHVTPGGPVVGAAAGALLGSPGGMSHAALALSNPALAQLLMLASRFGMQASHPVAPR
jgi:hypothetical protein